MRTNFCLHKHVKLKVALYEKSLVRLQEESYSGSIPTGDIRYYEDKRRMSTGRCGNAPIMSVQERRGSNFSLVLSKKSSPFKHRTLN